MKKLFIIALISVRSLLGIPYYMAAMSSEDHEQMQKEVKAVREKHKNAYDAYAQAIEKINQEKTTAERALLNKFDPEGIALREPVFKIEDEIAAIEKKYPNALQSFGSVLENEQTDEDKKAEEQINNLFQKMSKLLGGKKNAHIKLMKNNSDYQKEYETIFKQYWDKRNKITQDSIEWEKAEQKIKVIKNKYADKVRNESEYNRKIMGDK